MRKQLSLACALAVASSLLITSPASAASNINTEPLRTAVTVEGIHEHLNALEAIADDNKSKLSHLIDVVPAGDRVYMLVTAGPKSHATSDDAEKFRDSFRVLDDDSDADAQSASNPSTQ